MAKIINSPITEGKIRLKRFFPGIQVEDACTVSKCKGVAIWNEFLSYPVWGRNAVMMICPLCNHEWTVDIELTLTAKIAPKKKV